MDDLAVELAGIVGPTRVPIVAVGDHNTAVTTHVAAAKRHIPPAVACRFDTLDVNFEFDMTPKVETVGVVPQIVADESMAGMVRIAVRHREIGILGEPLRRY